MENLNSAARIHRSLTTSCKHSFNFKTNIFPKILFTKPSSKFISLTFTTQIPLASRRLPPTNTASETDSTKHRTLLVETYHQHRRLRHLLEELQKDDSCPLQILRDDGDWCKDHFWVVVKFLRKASRSEEILQVFHMWKSIEKSRISEFNYSRIIRLFVEEGMMEEAVYALEEMKVQCVRPSLAIYNSIIHGFSRDGKFDDALYYLSEMKASSLVPDNDTYEVLIQSYGKFKMFDEMGMCVRKMELDGCSPDHITYNILIQQYSEGGLFQKMEKIYQRMRSKRMHLQTSTLIAMLEAYIRFGMIEKMEKFYRRLLNSKTPLKDDLIRRLAKVYIDDLMFSKLEDLGIELRSTFGGTDLIWCLRLLSHACLLSRTGMDIIVQEMHGAKVHTNVNFANIIMLAYMKMKDFKHLRILLSRMSTHEVKPDIVTFGILFDANRIGFDGDSTLERWRTMGYLYRAVEMKTDPLVLAAFGKGHFLKCCEQVYSSLKPEDRERRTWNYEGLIGLVSKRMKLA